MRALRIPVLVIIAAALVTAFLLDRGTRPTTELAAPVRPSVPEVHGSQGTWFCPGGSAPNGRAEVALELVNAGDAPATATVAGIRSGTGAAAQETEVGIEAGARITIALADIVVDSAWMGALVEVDSGDVVVEQAYVGPTGTDRAPCHTRTATQWIVASGATREAALGEEMILLLLNPFRDDAVVDITFDADVGVDTLDGVVVPARRLVAVDVTDEVTVAGRVSAVLDVVAGRLAVSRLQVYDGDRSVGLAVTPAAADASPVWYLPTLHRTGRTDVVSVTNPSPSATAEVDLEIIPDGDARLDPIELTIRPGRTVQVAIADEERLAELGEFSMVARSLSGLPVAVMTESRRLADDDVIPTAAANVGADVAATGWLAPLDGDQSSLVIVNPSPATIATVGLVVIDADDRREIAEVEIGPGRRTVVRAEDLGADRPLVQVTASSPVVVGRDLIGVSSHRMAMGVVTTPGITDDRLD